MVKTVNRGNLGVYHVIDEVVYVWKGDRWKRILMHDYGSGGRYRTGCVVYDGVMSGDCALIPRRETACQPMRHLLSWQLERGSRMCQANSPTVSSRRTRS